MQLTGFFEKEGTREKIPKWFNKNNPLQLKQFKDDKLPNDPKAIKPMAGVFSQLEGIRRLGATDG
ncbi:hypothetical protein GCM10007100_25970 [Roseibacillus persicicus]|uniref:Uncharacterized protein n=1 Tax=Roseibacillus persicicus TaxID=454148 RepID=A0A918WLS0_9BACT|nr:hypothetical protein GCM10007100_25970 [Roseibacillus persicicus]